MALRVTIPLDRFLDLVVRTNYYAIIDDEDKRVIEACEGYAARCHIENTPDTVDLYNNALPVLRQGLYRLWLIKDWIEMGNRMRASLERFAEAERARQAKVETIIQHFIKTGISESVARDILKGMSADTILTTYNTISNPPLVTPT